MDRAQNAVIQWQQERPDIDVRSMVALGRIGQLHNLLSQQILIPFFAEYGLQPGEFDVLATLTRSGPPYALTPTALYEDAMISSGSMTNRIDHLAAAGLVERRPNPKDKRGTLVMLTEQGRQLIHRMLPAYVNRQNEVLALIGGQELEQLEQSLLHVIENIQKLVEQTAE